VKEAAIADSTSLIGLERIGRLDLLQSLFEPILISPKVREEFGVAVEWLKVQMPSNPMFVNMLKFVVDEGEAEAIALALEKGWQLIVDDRKARLWARRLGVRVIGTAGILVRAKRGDLVPSVKPLLESLKQAGFHLSSDLVAEVLRLAGEE
jgi:predicted nucleic acid-binding protein